MDNEVLGETPDVEGLDCLSWDLAFGTHPPTAPGKLLRLKELSNTTHLQEDKNSLWHRTIAIIIFRETTFSRQHQTDVL